MCPIRKNNPKTKICKQTMEKIRSLQASSEAMLFREPIKLEVFISGKTKADGDNIFKGVADALQGILYGNDRAIIEGYYKYNRYAGQVSWLING